MAGRGPSPKDPSKRLRRNAEAETTELTADSAPARARPLPLSKTRHPRTRRWWKAAATSLQAALFLETDWLVMERLADLYDAFFRGDTKIASEIRLCEAKLGFTPEDRLRLRWKLAAAKRDDDAAGDVDQPAAGGPGVDPRLRLVGTGGDA